MTQRNRPAVHVDITAKDRVTALKDQKVTASSWDPAKGAREAQQRIEEAVKQQWLREQEQQALDPTNQRILNLEQQVRDLKLEVSGLIEEMAAMKTVFGGK